MNNYKTPITGHIDILQIRNGLIHILDYKPEAEKINAIEQLTIYAMSLSRKLNLPLKDFKCAWFDESSYFEFHENRRFSGHQKSSISACFPLHSIYGKSNLKVIK